MSPARRWQDVKAEARRVNPALADPGVQSRARADIDAYVVGFHLKELRKSLGKTQAEVAAILGVSQSRVSQIETGELDAMELETLRSYAAALGGRLDVTVNIGDMSFHVA
ncbi:helix-turn-helix domain-containing protein [Embleya sp. NBC_00888]|uniref:helix-turn-helix domain-containing protein n=1 Tax=Embleya sp. NBC_00888 TaxID=2975960 RepID=UPI003866D224|nr:helix-turn-helix domain-containing protein [Embleya sp. NBC_00888]